MSVVAPKPAQTLEQKFEFATEKALEALVKKGIENGLLPLPLQVGVNNIPDDFVKEHFKSACKNVLLSLQSIERDNMVEENEQGKGVM